MFNTTLRILHRAGLALFITAAGTLSAQSVPGTINYQGRLTDNTPQQTPVNGAVAMQFEIWDAAAGGIRLWREPDCDSCSVSVGVAGGIFSYQLGSANPFPPALFLSANPFAQWHLQIILRPGASQELLAPRQQLGIVAFARTAVKAADSDRVGGIPAGSLQLGLAVTDCPAGEYFKSIQPDGSSLCAQDQAGVTGVAGGGGITGVITGGRLNLGSDATVQRRSVSPGCAAGQFLQSIAADGTPACFADAQGVTAAVSGGGVTGQITGGTLTLGSDATVQRRISAPSCATGQSLRALAADGTPTCVYEGDNASAPTRLTTLVVNGNGAVPYNQSAVTVAANNGYGRFYPVSTGLAAVLVPLVWPALVQGRALRVGAMTTCFRTNGLSYISRVRLVTADNTLTNSTVLDDPTSHSSATAQCFTLTPGSPTGTTDGLSLEYDLQMTAGSANSIDIGKITLALTE